MTDKHCPSEDELLAFADAALAPEQLRRIEQHLELCSSCAKRVIDLHTLIEDVAAPLPGSQLDVGEHVTAVMARLDVPVPRARSYRAASWWLGAVAAAAAAVLTVGLTRSGSDANVSRFAARGGPAAASKSRTSGTPKRATSKSGVHPARAAIRSGPSTETRESTRR